MNKWLAGPIIIVILISILLSGCASSGVPADYEQVKNTLTTVQSDLTAAKADLTAVKADLTAAKADLTTAKSDLTTAKADLTTAKADLTAAKAGLEATKATVAGLAPQVAGLSAASAYNIWYDQYYEIYNYQFADTDTFQKELGALITATNNAAAKTAWDAYLVSSSAEDFGNVGTALYDAAQYAVSQYSTLVLQYQVANVSLITAYNIWNDQYTLYNTDNQMYLFTDGTVFNTRLGDLITAANNSDVQAAWDAYIVADTALADVLVELPEDYNTWTAEQTNRWSPVSTARTTALGEVGTALYNAITG